MVLPLEKVSAAEVYIMRAVHGDDAVIRIVRVGERKISNAQEISRLRKKFRLAMDDKKVNIIDKLWPGISPQLPTFVEKPVRAKPERPYVAGPRDKEFAKEVYEDTLLDKPIALDADEFAGENEDDLGPEPPPDDSGEDDPLDDGDAPVPETAAPQPAGKPRKGPKPVEIVQEPKGENLL